MSLEFVHLTTAPAGGIPYLPWSTGSQVQGFVAPARFTWNALVPVSRCRRQRHPFGSAHSVSRETPL